MQSQEVELACLSTLRIRRKRNKDSRSTNQDVYSDCSSPVVIKNINQNSVSPENEKLLDEIVNMLTKLDRGPEVILLIGKSGVGKSSVINTIHRVLSGQEFSLTPHGSGTLDLGRYDNCGIDLRTIRDDSRRQKIRPILPKLPHFIDWCGFPDEDTPEIQEILELLLGGFFPKNTNIKELLRTQREYSVGCLKKIYGKEDPAYKVTQVVFIQSCISIVPKHLIKCLFKIMEMTNPTTVKRKYTSKIFLLITMSDLVRHPSVHQSSESDYDSITLEEFEDKEKKIARQLNIFGVLEAYSIRWASYSDNIKGTNEYIENNALRFMERIIQHGVPREETGQPVIGELKILELSIFKYSYAIKRFLQLNIKPVVFLIAIVFVVVIAVLYKTTDSL